MRLVLSARCILFFSISIIASLNPSKDLRCAFRRARWKRFIFWRAVRRCPFGFFAITAPTPDRNTEVVTGAHTPFSRFPSVGSTSHCLRPASRQMAATIIFRNPAVFLSELWRLPSQPPKAPREKRKTSPPFRSPFYRNEVVSARMILPEAAELRYEEVAIETGLIDRTLAPGVA